MTTKKEIKRPSKGQRTHNRRLKQAARKDGTVYTPVKVYRTPTKPVEE